MLTDYQLTITRLIEELKTGDQEAMEEVWKAYFDRLMEVAQRCMRGMPKQEQDEEDVLISVFHSLWQKSTGQRLSTILKRNDLWNWLVKLIHHRAIDLLRRAQSEKRDKRKIVEFDLLQVFSREPSPEDVTELNDSVNCFIEELEDDMLRKVFELHMQGNTVKEIAKLLKLSQRTIQRKIDVIRRKWEQDFWIDPTKASEDE